ncbi:hypothetical protein, partial [Streptomyces sp. NPDC004285]
MVHPPPEAVGPSPAVHPPRKQWAPSGDSRPTLGRVTRPRWRSSSSQRRLHPGRRPRRAQLRQPRARLRRRVPAVDTPPPAAALRI